MKNVTLMTHGKERVWLGRLVTEDDYLALVDWAKQISSGVALSTLPDPLRQFRFSPA